MTFDKIETGNLVKLWDNYPPPQERIILVVGGPYTYCNSDGEDWWTEWRGKDLKTDKLIVFSTRYHKFKKIN